MAVPEPNSPEAMRAAQKVRNVFYMIAAANFVIVALILWPRPKLPPQGKSPAESAATAAAIAREPLVQEMETVNERLLAAYHGRDAERFAEVFSSAAEPVPDEEYFRTVVIGRYHEEFGGIAEKTLASETKPEPDGGVLVYDFLSSKGIRGKSRVQFRREGGELRVLEWRLETL